MKFRGVLWLGRQPLPAGGSQMTTFIGRREFITLLGGAAAAWPLPAHAQGRMRKVGLLMGIESDPDARTRVKAFRQRLGELGWSEAQSIRIMSWLMRPSSSAHRRT